MRALIVKQPWASIIALEHKTIELRSWRTHHRGPLLILSSASAPEKYADSVVSLEPAQMPRRAAVCVAELVDCRPTVRADERDAGMKPGSMGGHGAKFAWCLANIRGVSVSEVIKGQRGLFDVPDEWITIGRKRRTRAIPTEAPRD